MEEFPANSHIGKKETIHPVGQEAIEPKKIEKIVTGEVHQRKKPLGKRFAETFFGGTAKGALQYVLMEVLLPTARDAVFDTFSQGVERVVYGDRAPGRRTAGRPGSPSGRNGYINYSQISSSSVARRERPETRSISPRARANHELDELVLGSRAEATAVLERMFDVINKYDVCSISDLYGMVGLTPQFTDEKWGWTDISDAKPVRVREGYVLDLPKPEYIE